MCREDQTDKTRHKTENSSECRFRERDDMAVIERRDDAFECAKHRAETKHQQHEEKPKDEPVT